MTTLATMFVRLALKDDATPGLDQLHAKLVAQDRTKHEVKVGLSDITPEVRALEGRLAGLEKNKVRLAVDKTSFSSDVSTLTRQLERLHTQRTSVSVDLAPGIDREIARVERELASASRKETTIPLRLEQIDSKVAALRSELTKLDRPVEVPVEVGGPGLRQRISAVRTAITGGVSDPVGMAHAGGSAGEHYREGFSARVRGLAGEIGHALVGGFLAVGSVEVFRKLIEEGEKAEKATLLTEAALKSTGEAAGVTGEHIDTLTRSLSRKDGVDQTSIRTGENLLLTFTGIRNEVGKGNNIYDQATTAVLNMSAALGQNTKDSAIQLGKALQDPVRGATTLRRVGVALTQQQQDQIKAFVASGKTLEAQKVILAELGTEFGGAAEAAATPLDKLKTTVEDLARAAGTALLPIIGRVADGLSSFVQQAQDGTGEGAKLHDALASVGGALRTVWDVTKQALPVVKGLADVLGGTLFASSKAVTTGIAVMLAVMSARKLADFAGALTAAGTRLAALGGTAGTIGGRLAGFSTGLGRVASFLGGPWGIAIGIGITALVGFATKQSEAAKAAKALTDQLTFENGALDENSRQTLAKSLADAGSLAAAVKAGVAEKDFTDAIVNGGDARKQMVVQLGQIVAAHTLTIDSGYGATTAIDSTGKAAQTALDGLQAYSNTVDTSAQHSKEAAAAIGEQGAATREGIPVAKQLQTAQANLAGANRALAQTVQDVINKFTILRQGALDQEQANEGWRAALDNVSASVKANGKALDVNTAKGRGNRSMIVDATTALNNKVTADFKNAYSTSKSTTETGKLHDALKVANAEIRTGRKDIDDSAHSAGLNRDKVDKMVSSMLKTPKQLKTDIINNAEKAKKKVADYQRQIDSLHGKGIKMTASFSTDARREYQRLGIRVAGVNSSGGLTVFAAGGQVGLGWARRTPGGPKDAQHKDAGGPVQDFTGAGRTKHDTQKALLRVDEHVWTPEEVDAAGGHKAVFRLRKAALSGVLKGYDQGGDVTSSPVTTRYQMGAGIDTRPMNRADTGILRGIGREWLKGYEHRVISDLVKRLKAAEAGLGDSRIVNKALNDVGMRYAIGMCLQFVRTLIGARGGEYDAAAGWRDTDMKHPRDWNAPPGTPMWWGGGHGHVALSVGGGKIVSTDLPVSGRVGLVDKHTPSTRWGKPYLGWSGDINGTVIPLGGAYRTGSAGASGGLKGMAQQLLRLHGWEAQYPALKYIVDHESGWNVHARNPSSGAYGLGQALPASKMAPFGADYQNSGNTQLRWMLSYIGSRYGDPDNAAAFWRAHHWYGAGGPVGLQDGALVRGGRGGVLAAVGEGSRDELVTPLPRGWDAAKPPATSDDMLRRLILAIGHRTAPLVNVERVDSGVDLDLFARQSSFRERAGVFT